MHKWSVRLLALVAAVVLSACGERLESGAACPLLCPGQSLALRDTTVEAVILDTTLTGFPPRGASSFLALANSGDTVEARYVVRFDSLPSQYLKGDSLPITEVDSAVLRISFENTLSRFSGPVTFEVYDVDSPAEDSVTAALIPLFRPDLLLGTVTVDSAALKDSVRIFLDDSRIGQKVSTRTRVRLGVRVRSTAAVRLAVISANGAGFARLALDPAPADTSVDALSFAPRSSTPANDPRLATDFTDFNVFVGGAPPPPGVVGVGGPGGRRIYYRFNVPARITDSATIVRATLVLNQRPAPTYGFTDSITVSPVVVVATKEVTDLSKAALLTDTLTPGNIQYIPGLHPSRFRLSNLRIPSGGSGERRFDLANVVSVWRSTSAERLPPAIILRSANESSSILEAQFYSIEASPELRPRLVITYLPRSEFGLP